MCSRRDCMTFPSGQSYRKVLRASRALKSPAKHHVNNNWPSVFVKGYTIRGCADEGGLISFSKYSICNFYIVRRNWLLTSSLISSGHHLLDTPRSSFFRQSSISFIVFRAIHQERAVFLVGPFSRRLFVICCPTLWC